MKTIRLTMSQALVRYLVNQHTMIDGKKEPLFPGVFAIFGHGNVTCLGEARGGALQGVRVLGFHGFGTLARLSGVHLGRLAS